MSFVIPKEPLWTLPVFSLTSLRGVGPLGSFMMKVGPQEYPRNFSPTS